MNELNKNFPIHDEVDDDAVAIAEFVPRSARKKIEAELKAKKAKTGSPESGSILMDRRQFLKASAITGAVAVAASSGLIYAAGREESEAGAGTSEAVASASDLEGLQAELGFDYAAEVGEKVPVRNMAHAIVRLLEAYNVDYIFWLTDDEITPIADAMTTRVMEGRKPWPICAMHEFGAAAMAGGYAAATEKVGVGFFGANQGPMNAHGALWNEYGHCLPVVMIASHNPEDEGPYRSGQFWTDPGELVRECTKWTYHFLFTDNLEPAFKHAFAVADTHPKGPVMITTAHNVLTSPMPDGTVTIPDASRLTAARPTVPNGDALEEAADLLFHSENPVIVAGKGMGRRAEAVNQLVGLAELLGAPVIESGRIQMTFPSDHPLHLGFSTSPYVKDADVILIIEARAKDTLSKTAKVIQLDPDPVMGQALGFRGGGICGEVDVRMEGETYASIPALMEKIMGITPGWGQFKKRAKERTERWTIVHDQQRADWQAIIDSHMGEKPISSWRAAYEIDKVAGDDTILLDGLGYGSSRVWIYCWHLNEPKTYIRDRAGHIGQAPWAAIGAACGRPDKQIIMLGGDLQWHMGHESSALWTAAHHNLPIVFIMDDNHWLVTTKNGQMGNNLEGVEYDFWWAHEVFPPWTDYSHYCKGLGIFGECVKEPDRLGPALREALDWAQKNSLPAFLDVWTAPLK